MIQIQWTYLQKNVFNFQLDVEVVFVVHFLSIYKCHVLDDIGIGLELIHYFRSVDVVKVAGKHLDYFTVLISFPK